MMHRYLVDKYGIEFDYAGYVPSGFGQKEELTALPAGADKNDSRSYVTVRCVDNVLSDNYGDYQILMHIEKMYDDYAQDYFGSDKVKVFAHYVYINELGEIDFDNIKSFEHKLSICSLVFISSEICDKDKCEVFSRSMMDHSLEKDLSGTSRVCVVKDVDIAELTNDNCADCYRNYDCVVADFDISFNEEKSSLSDCTH